MYDEVVYIYVYTNWCNAVIILNNHFYRHLCDRNASLFCQSYGLLLVGLKLNQIFKSMFVIDIFPLGFKNLSQKQHAWYC